VLLVLIYFGFIAATHSASHRKGKARFVATFAFGFWFCTMGVLMTAYNETRPVFEFTGVINGIQVLRSDNKHYSAYVHLASPSDGILSVHVSGRSDCFRLGEHMWLRYQGGTHELVKATFFSSNGSPQGVFRSTLIFEGIGPILIGSFVIWVAFKEYRRDPEGTEK